MKIKEMITEVLDTTPSFVEVGFSVDPSYPSGFVGILGSFDYSMGQIDLTLVSQYDIDETFHWDNPKALEFYQSELRKALKHEMVHLRQLLRGECFDDMPAINDDEELYYAHPLEIEAYGRADMCCETNETGYSETLALYSSLFGADSTEVLSLTRFCEDETNSYAVV